jgi:hypothetical protein
MPAPEETVLKRRDELTREMRYCSAARHPADGGHVRHALFEAWVVAKIAELQVAQEQAIARLKELVP